MVPRPEAGERRAALRRCTAAARRRAEARAAVGAAVAAAWVGGRGGRRWRRRVRVVVVRGDGRELRLRGRALAQGGRGEGPALVRELLGAWA